MRRVGRVLCCVALSVLVGGLATPAAGQVSRITFDEADARGVPLLVFAAVPPAVGPDEEDQDVVLRAFATRSGARSAYTVRPGGGSRRCSPSNGGGPAQCRSSVTTADRSSCTCVAFRTVTPVRTAVSV